MWQIAVVAIRWHGISDRKVRRECRSAGTLAKRAAGANTKICAVMDESLVHGWQSMRWNRQVVRSTLLEPAKGPVPQQSKSPTVREN
jgi:hypothetical protein